MTILRRTLVETIRVLLASIQEHHPDAVSRSDGKAFSLPGAYIKIGEHQTVWVGDHYTWWKGEYDLERTVGALARAAETLAKDKAPDS